MKAEGPEVGRRVSRYALAGGRVKSDNNRMLVLGLIRQNVEIGNFGAGGAKSRKKAACSRAGGQKCDAENERGGGGQVIEGKRRAELG